MNCGKFIGELMRARDITHIEHLQAKHWGGHMALNEIYEALEDHIDTVAELRLARGPVDTTIKDIPERVDIVPYLNELVDKLDKAKEMMDDKGYNDISAEIDMIKSTVMKGLYKLKNLTKQGKHGKHGKHEDKKDRMNEILEDKQAGGILYKKKCKGGKAKCGGGKMLIKK